MTVAVQGAELYRPGIVDERAQAFAAHAQRLVRKVAWPSARIHDLRSRSSLWRPSVPGSTHGPRSAVLQHAALRRGANVQVRVGIAPATGIEPVPSAPELATAERHAHQQKRRSRTSETARVIRPRNRLSERTRSRRYASMRLSSRGSCWSARLGLRGAIGHVDGPPRTRSIRKSCGSVIEARSHRCGGTGGTRRR